MMPHAPAIHFSGCPWPLLIVLAAASTLLLRHYALFLKRARFARPWLPWTLRALTLALLILLAAGPTIQYTARRPVTQNAAVMIDTSQSMSLPDAGGGQTRLQRAEELLKSLKKIPGLRLSIFEFDRESRRVSEKSAFDSSPLVGDTEVIPSILSLPEDRAADLSSVILFTDGQDRSGMHPFAPLHDASGHAVPVYAVGLGAKDEKNVSLAPLLAPETAYTGQPLTVRGSFRSKGIGPAPVTLEFMVDGKRAQVKRETAAPGGAGREFSFTLRPDALGLKRMTVRVGSTADETTKIDNERHAFVRILNAKKQILYVDAPRWENAFLHRTLAARDDLAPAFLTLTPGGPLPGESASRAALASEAKLTQYEAIVVGAVRPELTSAETAALANYARDGGFLIVLGGSNSLLETDNALLRSLGLRPERAPDAEGAFFPKLTAQGREEPLLRAAPSAERNAAMWESLPYAYTFSPVSGSAAALASHPWKTRAGRGWPLVLTVNAGRGRALVFTFDGMWRWKFSENGAEVYDAVWNNVLTEALRRTVTQRVSLYLPKRNVPLGEMACFDAGGSEISRIELRSESGITTTLTPSLSAGTHVWRACTRPSAAGLYTAQAVAAGGGRSAVEPFAVEVNDEEFLPASRNDSFLRSLAKITGGAYLAEPDAARLREAVGATRAGHEERVTADLWRYPWLYAVLLLLPFAEWALRRRGGLT